MPVRLCNSLSLFLCTDKRKETFLWAQSYYSKANDRMDVFAFTICTFLNCYNSHTTCFDKYVLGYSPLEILVPFKRVLHLLPKISMFCALSQNNQELFEKINHASDKKLFKDFKNGIEILVGQAVSKLQIKTVKMLLLDP